MSDDFELPPPFSHMATTPRARATVRVVRAAPVSRFDHWRDHAVPAAERKRDGYFQMPQMQPAGLPAMSHLRKPGATSVISTRVAAPTTKQPVVRVAKSYGTVRGAEITGIIER